MHTMALMKPATTYAAMRPLLLVEPEALEAAGVGDDVDAGAVPVPPDTALPFLAKITPPRYESCVSEVPVRVELTSFDVVLRSVPL